MEKFLLFSTGAGNDDLQNLQGNEVALYKATDLVTARPSSIRTIDLLFRSESGSHDTVTLGIKGVLISHEGNTFANSLLISSLLLASVDTNC